MAATNYSISKGSVIIDLKTSFLETLSVGEHTLTARFTDGDDVTVSFKISSKAKQDDNNKETEVKKPDNNANNNKKAIDTGDKMNIRFVVMLMLSSGLAALYLTLRKKMIK